jgi:uncharacterized protein YbjQ (UPF0145 family)
MASPPANEEERLRLGMEALARGELPPHVRDRLSNQWRRGTWTSNLSVPEFAAIRSVGFTPVGQVMGSAVYRVGWRVQPACKRFTWGVATELTPFSDALQHVRGLALDRMVQEAAALDSHGVVGVKVAFRWFSDARSAVEYTAMGTAVRRQGAPRLAQPFVSGVGGQDFAKLLRGGLVPCGLAMGIGTFHVHMGWASRRTQYQTAEVSYLPDMSAKARARACEVLVEQVIRMRGGGAVGASTWLQVRRTRCPVESESEQPDYILQFSVEGTVVARFDGDGVPSPSPVIHLQP